MTIIEKKKGGGGERGEKKKNNNKNEEETKRQVAKRFGACDKQIYSKKFIGLYFYNGFYTCILECIPEQL